MNTLENWLADPDAVEIGKPKTTLQLCEDVINESRRIEAKAMQLLAELSAERAALQGAGR